MNTQIWHNPRCSKSRATLALLEEQGIEADIVEYLKTPPTAEALSAVLKKLGMKPAQLIRTGEAAWKESGLTADSPDDALIDLMIREPILIERPIVVHGDRARIGRPPESVLGLFA